MKLSFFICLIAFLQVSASSLAQKISLNKSNASLWETVNDIRRQSGYSILCDPDILVNAKPVTIELKDASLADALKACFANQPFNYVINQKTILITEKKVSAKVAVPPITINGVITDEHNTPLPGVTVKVKSSQVTTVTNADGVYRIIVPDEKAILVFSSIGFASQEISVSKQTSINIILKEQNSSLSEIVVIGYGTQKRSDLTGAISSISGKDLTKTTNVSINEALQGRIAGVQVVSDDGAPGANVNVSIRGGSSISAGNDPLYVIDGFPQLGGSNLNLSAEDIESIEVLKDASATAIYGSRGSNGVVIITTKNAKSGRFTVSYSPTVSYQSIIKKLPVINAMEFAEVQHSIFSTPVGSGNDLTYANWQSYKDTASINWQDVIYKTGVQQNHNLSFSGGNNDIKVAGSFGYLDQTGIAVGTDFSRYTGKLNAITTISKTITNGTNIYLSGTQNIGPSLTGATGIGQGVLLASPVVNNGNLAALLSQTLIGTSTASNDISNPLLELTTPNLSNKVFNGLVNSYFAIAITPDLTLKISGGINYMQQNINQFYPLTTNIGRLYNGYAAISGANTVDWINENTLTYNKTFAHKHNTSTVIGYTMENNVQSSNTSTAENFPVQSLGYNNLALGGTLLAPISNKANFGLESFLGRTNYNYSEKYFLTASFRADGSSKFPDHKWGFFPAGALAWKVTEEDYMKEFKAISSMKLRVSWGQTGNQSIPSYSSATVYGAANAIIGNTNTIGLAPTQLGNQDLKWETNTQTNLGLDVGLLGDRITLTADAYRKVSSNLLLNAPISYYSGYSSVYRNIGSASVKGLELTLNTINLTGKFQWISNFNISFTRSKVLSLTDGQTFITQGTLGSKTQNYIIEVGKPLGAIYGYIANGVFNNQEELVSSAQQAGISQLGSRKYKDVSGPAGVPDGKIDAYDQTIIGNGNPDFYGGFSNTFTYKGFDLDVLFTFSYGNDILNGGKSGIERASGFHGGSTVMLNHWTPQTPDVNYPKWGLAETEATVNTSYLVEDGSYLRLKTLRLGYTIPGNILHRLPVKSVRVFISAENILTITKYSGYDPEVNYFNSIITPGADLYNYPRAKVFSFGGNINF